MLCRNFAGDLLQCRPRKSPTVQKEVPALLLVAQPMAILREVALVLLRSPTRLRRHHRRDPGRVGGACLASLRCGGPRRRIVARAGHCFAPVVGSPSKDRSLGPFLQLEHCMC